MANVLFKRGLETSLPANGSAQDGVLYFALNAADNSATSGRLFLGMPNGNRVPIAEGITTVTSIASLPAAAQHAGEFYYETSGNILAYSNGTSWLQVNLSSEVTSLAQAATASEDSGTVTLTLSQEGGSQGDKTASFVLTGSDNLHIAAGTGANELVLSADDTTYTLGTAAGTVTTNAAKVQLTPSVGSVQAFEVVGKNGVTVTLSNNNIELAVDPGEVGAISSFSMGNGDGDAGLNGFYGDITEAGGGHKIGSIDPVIAFGNNAAQSAHFTSGTATLAVYTISEVDDLIDGLEKTLDAVVYRGTAASEATLTTTEGVHNGDAWKASATFSLNGAEVPVGALIIARGTETDGVIPAGGVTYDVITGDTADTTYSFSGITHGVILKSSTGSESSSFALATDSAQLVLSDSGSGEAKTVSIALATVSVGSSTGTAIAQSAGNGASINAVTAVSTDSYGRVTGIEKTSFSVLDTVLSASERALAVATANNVATVSDTVKDTAGNEAVASFAIGSAGNSITVTSSDNAINLDLVWGSF